jgi:hypothetical protein
MDEAEEEALRARFAAEKCLKRALAAELAEGAEESAEDEAERRSDCPRHFGLRSLKNRADRLVVLSPFRLVK